MSGAATKENRRGPSEMGINNTQVWSASYAGVEVFQILLNGTAIMRRRKDSYINATHILKCARFDKPHRTRFLERQIHTGIHEKVQGGYGKYQGTWVPLERAKSLAKELGVFDMLQYLFDYNPAPGEKPPTAPRSLESMYNKRKTKENGEVSERGAKRRIGGSINASKQHQQPKRQGSGSLSSILNRTSPEVSLSAQMQQEPTHQRQSSRASVNAVGGPSAGWHEYSAPNSAPATPQNGRNVHSSLPPPMQYQQKQQYGYQHQQQFDQNKNNAGFMTPETPENGTGYHLLQQAGSYRMHDRAMPYEQATPTVAGARQMERQSEMQAPPSMLGYNDGNNSAHSGSGSPPNDRRALRDISSGYHRAHPAMQSASKSHSSSLMTPPPSVMRRPGPVVQRPPVSVVAPVPMSATSPFSALSAHTTAMTTASSMSTAAMPLSTHLTPAAHTAPIVNPAPRTTSGSTSTAPSPPNTYLLDYTQQLVAYLSQPRVPQQRAQSEISHLLVSQRLAPVVNTPISADGLTLLHLAMLNAHWDVVQTLLNSGANSTSTTRDGQTALMLALGFPSIWRDRGTNILTWLLEAMPLAMFCRDKQGRSVLHWASMTHLRTSEWTYASAYYIQELLKQLKRLGRTDVIGWADAKGRRAFDLAKSAGLDETADILERAMPPKLDIDRYNAVAVSASELITTATLELQRDHKRQQAAIDADTEHAASLLLDLRREHESTQQTARSAQAVIDQLDAAQQREQHLKRCVEHAVNLQQAARIAAVMQTPTKAATNSQEHKSSSEEDLRAELHSLRRQAQMYELKSRELASEYADLAALVRPWPRPPALTLFESEEGAGSRVPSLSSSALSSTRHSPSSSVADAETADVKAITAALAAEERRLQKFERVVEAACGDLTLDKVRTVVGPVLSVLNNGNTL
ncbi:Transcription factor mbp1 [Coemansia interrupta]|uniref:Transcription factor mbp1 n=1 Tax=Coemansia interrupta TaxID=1126814 RepID=A0A9W8HI20_9FUNG|nr:Transcription factor mbp1 [Coemansia interrupta]